MKVEFEEASCSCGWSCLVLKSAKADVFHCGMLLEKKPEEK